MILACNLTILVLLQLSKFEVSLSSVFYAPVIGFNVSAQEGHYKWSEWDLYKHWKKAHHKLKQPNEIEIEKFAAWSNNFRKVSSHNLRFTEGREMYLQNLNKLSDHNLSNLTSLFLPSVALARFYEGMKPVKLPEVDAPDGLNWSLSGWTWHDKLRTIYPIGWAVSVSRAIAAQKKNATGIFTRLSEQELLDCVKVNDLRPVISKDAFSYILENGISKDTIYRRRYPPIGRNCRKHRKEPFTFIREYHLLLPEDQENLRVAVATIGPVSISIKLTENFFLYKTGVFYDHLCQDEGEEPMHSVLLIGYGTDLALGEFWIIQNNWGNTWGENGFARMARNTIINCGVASAAFYALI